MIILCRNGEPALPHPPTHSAAELDEIKSLIRQWSKQLGFQQVGVSDIDLSQAEGRLGEWLDKGYHGTMGYMSKHGTRRSRPAELLPNTCRVISVRMDYLPHDSNRMEDVLHKPEAAYISRYALGRDYHKVLRKKLQQLADYVQQAIGDFGYRVFVDSAPVMEKPLAEKGNSAN